MISAILFDLDGVLVDACDWHYDALNMALTNAGYEIISREDHISTYNGLPTKIKLEMMGIPNNQCIEINQQKQKYTLEIIKKTANIMKEKIELHEYLKSKGIRIACVTNSIEETARAMLTSTGQMPYIDLLVSNEQVSRNKPYPDCYNYAINTLGVEPKNCLCVEDSPKGIEAAKASIADKLWIVSNCDDVNKENYVKFMEEKYANIDTNGR